MYDIFIFILCILVVCVIIFPEKTSDIECYPIHTSTHPDTSVQNKPDNSIDDTVGTFSQILNSENTAQVIGYIREPRAGGSVNALKATILDTEPFIIYANKKYT